MVAKRYSSHEKIDWNKRIGDMIKKLDKRSRQQKAFAESQNRFILFIKSRDPNLIERELPWIKNAILRAVRGKGHEKSLPQKQTDNLYSVFTDEWAKRRLPESGSKLHIMALINDAKFTEEEVKRFFTLFFKGKKTT